MTFFHSVKADAPRLCLLSFFHRKFSHVRSYQIRFNQRRVPIQSVFFTRILIYALSIYNFIRKFNLFYYLYHDLINTQRIRRRKQILEPLGRSILAKRREGDEIGESSMLYRKFKYLLQFSGGLNLTRNSCKVI